MAKYIVLLGPPGVGKGTQAEILAEKIGLTHVSSGDLFRENIKNNTELGKQAQTFIDKGELVPDDVTIAMVKERLSRARLQGRRHPGRFPADARSGRGAPKDAGGLSTADVNVVPFITAAPKVLIERASGRWTCKAQGHIYHQKFNPPKVSGVCDIDGSELYQREDDKAETVARRINVYLQQTAPLVDYYRAQRKLVEIDGTQPIEQVTDFLVTAIEK